MEPVGQKEICNLRIRDENTLCDPSGKIGVSGPKSQAEAGEGVMIMICDRRASSRLSESGWPSVALRNPEYSV